MKRIHGWYHLMVFTAGIEHYATLLAGWAFDNWERRANQYWIDHPDEYEKMIQNVADMFNEEKQ